MERGFLSQKGSGGRGVKEKSFNALNLKVVMDGVTTSISVASGSLQEENVGTSSTGLAASESMHDVSFASLLKDESKLKGMLTRLMVSSWESGWLTPLLLTMLGILGNPNVNLMKEDVVNVPVWVKLHGVPVTAFTVDGLSAIATDICTPLMMDSYTSDMCIQSWGRSSYARALIEIRADVELKDTIVVAMPKLTREECPKNPGDNEVCSVDNDMARSMAKETVGFGTQSRDLPDKLQDICDNLDIRVRGPGLARVLKEQNNCQWNAKPD
ncbi:putative reverse transcriptase domain-containing protein [Tanacetum coccineum]